VAWESRCRGRYYYAAARQDGRVVKCYVGRGPLAELAAGLDAEARRRRAGRAEAVRDDQARHEPAERALAELDAACALLTEAILTAAGYRRVNHGPWKRRRRARSAAST
jgi:hypothetical protein